jgi:hypothetical protein
MGFHQHLLLMGVIYGLLNQGIAWAQEASSLGDGDSQFSHKVEVHRQGRQLILHYELVDSEGKTQDLRKITEEAPRFAVYQGKKKLATGQFEFG